MPSTPRSSLSGNLASAIASQIEVGAYKVGDRLPSEQEMTREYSVSRTVVREAIASLRANGLVTTSQGRGAFVLRREAPDAFRIESGTQPLIQEVISLLELRIAIESEASVLAAQRRTETQLAAMEQTIHDMQAAIAAGDDATRPDMLFHRHIAEAAGNPHFLKLLVYIGENGIPRSRLPSFDLAGDTRQNYLTNIMREHEQICYAIRRKDSEAARAALRLHLTSSRDRLLHVSGGLKDDKSRG